MDELKNIEPFRSSYAYTDVCQGRPHSVRRVSQGRPHSTVCVKVVLTLARVSMPSSL